MEQNQYAWDRLGLSGWLVCFVYLVNLVHLVSFAQPNKRDKPNKPEQPARSHGLSRREHCGL